MWTQISFAACFMSWMREGPLFFPVLFLCLKPCRFPRAHVSQLKLKQGKTSERTGFIIICFFFASLAIVDMSIFSFKKKNFWARNQTYSPPPKAVLLLFSTVPKIEGPVFPCMRRAIVSYSQPIRMSDLTLSISSNRVTRGP